MNADLAQAVVRRMLGWWATPALTDEEALGWIEELTSPALGLTPEESLAALRRAAHAGQVHRPRPGEVIAAVQAERRARARLDDTTAMLESKWSSAVTPDRAGQWCRALRRVAAHEATLEEAKASEGLG